MPSDYHRRYLEDLRWILTRDFWVHGEQDSPGPEGDEERIAVGLHRYARQYLMSMPEPDREQLILVEEALARLEHGEYARCLRCGQAVEESRLDMSPWLRHCATCEAISRTHRGSICPTS